MTKHSLLKDQLAESGLEMSIIDPGTATIIAAGISGGSSILGGIFGASEADRQNKAAEEAYKKQLKAAKELAKAQNKQQRLEFRAEKDNYYNQRDFQIQLDQQNYQQQLDIQAYQERQALRQYQRDIQIRDQQLDFNDLGAKQAYSNETAALAGVFTQQLFDREDQVIGLQKALAENILNRRTTQLEMESVVNKGMFASLNTQEGLREFTKEIDYKKQDALVENLKAQGQNELRQASLRKGTQATVADFYQGMSQLNSVLTGRQRQIALKLAEVGIETSILEKKLGIQMEGVDNAAMNAVSDAQFNMRVLDRQVADAIDQSQRNLTDISLRKYGADLNAAAQVMIKPEPLPTPAAPLIPPERIFVKPMKIQPGAVQQPFRQSVAGPLISGLIGAATTGAQMAFTSYMGKQPSTAGQFFPTKVTASNGAPYYGPAFGG